MIEIAKKLSLKHFLWSKDVQIPASTNIVFLPSFTSEQRTSLLHSAVCLVYTPSDEHFGIVPLEGMYSGLPVVACNSGGPKETVVDGKTGLLCEATAHSFSDAIKQCLTSDVDFKKQGKEHVANNFSLSNFGDQLEKVVYEAMETVNFDAWITFYAVMALVCCLNLIFLLFII